MRKLFLFLVLCTFLSAGCAFADGWTDDGSVVRLDTGSDAVGMGTASPTMKLHVEDNASGSAVGICAKNTSTSAGSDAMLNLFTSASGAGDPWIRFDISGVNVWGIGTDNSDGGRFKISNNVLGTNDIMTFSTSYVEVDADLYIGSNELQTTNMSLRQSGSDFVMEKNGTKLLDILVDTYTDRISEFRLWQDTEPNRPAPILDLYNIGKCGEVVIRFANDANTEGSLDPGVWILGIPPSTRGTGHNHFMLNRDGETAYLIVDENQHVGIGNFDSHPADGQHPDALLEVRGLNADDTQMIVKAASEQTANLQEWQDSSGSVKAVIDEEGKVGIAKANPTVELDIQGTVQVDESDYSNNRWIKITGQDFIRGGDSIYLATDTGGSIKFRPGGSSTDLVSIDSAGKLQVAGDAYLATTSGDVGIGTTDPGAKLDVSNGNIAVSTQGNGIILKATDGNKCYLLTVNNNGVLSTTEITCP